MRTMIDKALLIALGAMLAAAMRGFGAGGLAMAGLAAGGGVAAEGGPWITPTDALLLAGLLAAVCVAGLGEWLMGSRRGWIPSVLYAAAALIVPVWTVFLPSVAYDAARARTPVTTGTPAAASAMQPGAPSATPSAGSIVRRMLSGLPAWAWAVPVCAVLARPGGLTALNLVAAIAVCVGFAFGTRAAAASRVRGELRAFEDRVRASVRSSRVRLADLTEERDRSARTATLAERTRIAREIHDNVGHLLTRAIMQTGAGKAVADATGDAVAARGFTDVAATLDDAMTMVRRSVHDLEDEGTDFAGRICDAARSFDGVSPGFTVMLANDVTAAPAPVARCFATVIREALSNVVHHSDAPGASVTLRDFPAFWQLVIRDDGPAKAEETGKTGETAAGMNAAGTGTGTTADGLPRGMGLADIEARVRSLGGTAVCGPYAGGWRVFVSVPKERWSESKERRSEVQSSPAGR